jgi:hypothetical protein
MWTKDAFMLLGVIIGAFGLRVAMDWSDWISRVASHQEVDPGHQ